MYSKYTKIEKIGDILTVLSSSSNDKIKPKRITLDLSEDGKFYHTRMYIDIIDRNINKEYKGYIECHSNINTLNNFDVVYDHDNRDAEIFTITIPEE